MSGGDDEDRQAVEGRIGTTLRGKYLLEKVIGVGGMAAVYRATNTVVRRACAVKVLHRDYSAMRDLKARFLREGRVANAVGHRSAVDVLDADTADDGSAFLVMELLDGESIDTLAEARGGRLDLRCVLWVAHALLGVLAVAHAKGIVHRDLKPANLFLTKDGDLKVLDFGIAHLRETGTNIAITRTGVAMGTPAFMSPEQALGKMDLVGPRSDVWSVGATIFALLANRAVHEAETVQEMMVLVATKPAPSLAMHVHGLPPSVVTLVDRALAFERDARWRTATEMGEAIHAAHVAIFGEPPPARWTSGAHGPSVGSPKAARPSDEIATQASTLPVAGESGPKLPTSTLPLAVEPPPLAVAASARSMGRGNTTVQPISAEPSVPIAPLAPVPILTVVGLAALLAVVAGVTYLITRSSRAVATEPSSSSSTSSLPSTSSSSTLLARATPAASASGSPPDGTSTPPQAAATSRAPAASAAVRRPAGPAKVGPTSTPTAPSPPTQPAPPAQPPPPPKPPPTRDPLAP